MGARGRWAMAGKAAFILCWCALLPPVMSGQSLQGRFFTPKNTYLVGEPIFVTYELLNTGPQPLWIDGRLDDPCFDQSPITVENASPARHRWKTALDCGPTGFGGSCLSSEVEIKPGQTHSGRIYANHYYGLDQPGIYEIDIDWNIHMSDGPIPSFSAETVEVMGNVDIRVVQGTEPELESAFQPVLRDLASADYEIRGQSLQAVTEQAQPFLEQTILDLSRNPEDVWPAIEGLYRINTPQTRSRLADLAEHSQSEDGIRAQAVQALAATGDTSYLPLLFRLARTLKGYEQAMAIESAGLLGGDKAVSFLLNFLRSPDPLVRGAAVRGLAGTASRNAVGPLIQELGDSDASVRENASFALTQLTHRSVSQHALPAEADPASTFQIWVNWWLTQGRNATVYDPTECAEPTPLN
ncbi:MAG TPA: HEAT repeat domain-containing protein [Terriglobia bacterium]|nr:HEAT repeat domain-containing protein [Terriglobia bacterium]